MRVLYDNLIEDYSSLTATNENASYPVGNVVNKSLHKKFQATTTTSTVTVEWAADQTVDCLAFAYHNITELTYTVKNSGGGTLETDTLTGGSDIFDGDIIYLTSSYSTVRSIEFAFTGSDPFYIGYIGAGIYLQMPGFSASVRHSRSQIDQRFKSFSGRLFGDNIGRLKGFSVTFASSNQSELDNVLTFYDAVSTVDPFIMDLYEATRNTSFYYPFYAGINEFSDITKNGNEGVLYGYNFQIEECT